jgi:VCBS repeat-containing protein
LAIDASTGAVTLIKPADFETKADYSFTVVATDAVGLTAEKAVTVDVTNANDAPVMTSIDTGTVAENAPASTVIYSAVATDVDADDTRSYSLKAATGDAAAVAINASTGAVTLIKPADFETKASYNFIVVATDRGGLTAEKAVTVSVTNVNDAPVMTSADTGTVAENAPASMVIYTVVATDVDVGDTRSYSLKAATGDAAALVINASTGAVTLIKSADFETKASYNFTVIATDKGGLATEKAVTVSVTNVNDAPVMTSAGTGTVAENAPASTVIYSAVATDVDADDTRSYSLKAATGDAAAVAVDASTGAVTLIKPADFETKASYNFTVIATDKAGLTAEKAVTVSVTDVNDAPTLNKFPAPVARGDEGKEITVTFTDLQDRGDEADVDGTVSSFAIKAVSTGNLKIGSSAATATAWDAGTNNTVTADLNAYWTSEKSANGVLDAFTAVAIDDGGLESATPVQAKVIVTAVNDAPTLRAFAAPVASGDEDKKITVTFADLQAQGDAADVDGTVDGFAIKAVSSGSLKIGSSSATATAWDADTNNTVTAGLNAYWTSGKSANGVLDAFTAVAIDNGGLESSTPIQATVTVAAVNDAPTFNAFVAPVAGGDEDNEIVVTFSGLQAQSDAVDMDGTVASFEIKAVSSGSLKIGSSAATATAWNANTNHTVNVDLNAYWTPKIDANGVLDAFTAVAKDNGGLESAASIQATVAVAAINDSPTNLAISAKSINEGVEANSIIGTLSSTDPDAGDTFTYSLASGGDNNAFTIVGDQLKINSSPNFDSQSSYSILVRSTDQDGLFFDKALDIGINHVIRGGEGDDEIDGGESNDAIDGGEGSDAINSGAGDDVADGGLGDDVMDGGEGSDSIDGGEGNDAIDGGVGDDVADGGVGNDVMDGGEGSDSIDGGEGNDAIDGGVGDDVADGGEGNDAIDGGTGNDVADGGEGSDSIDGGVGNDRISGGVGNNTLVGGEGNDTLDYSGLTLPEQKASTLILGVSVDLSKTTQQKTSANSTDTLSGFENLTGSSYADSLTGNTDNNVFNGGGGNDTINGGAGNDTLVLDGVAADYKFLVGKGLNSPFEPFTFTGLKVTDVLEIATSKNNKIKTVGIEKIQFGDGSTVDVSAQTPQSLLYSAATYNNDNLVGTVGNDTIAGLQGNDTLDGGLGDDTLIGGVGNDSYIVDSMSDVVTELVVKKSGIDTINLAVTYAEDAYSLASNIEKLGADLLITAISLTGNGGSNTITGGVGDDLLNGGAGADSLVGGLGNDTYIIDSSKDKVTENSKSLIEIDTVQSSINYTLGSSLENLTLTGSASTGTGNALDNNLVGNDGKNNLKGNAGNDTLDGGAGADALNGGAGNETLVYDSADSKIDGGAGNDLLKFSGSGITLDLSQLKVGKITGIEKLDLSGTGNNNLLVNTTKLVSLTGSAGHKLYVVGDQGDSVTISTLTGPMWKDTGIITDGYHQYIHITGAVTDYLYVLETLAQIPK